ncbi:MAG: DUF4255 domain-containing protein [Bacteroidales bacterium]|jgi:hypothetical protein|nr:DUF4255 domain-containing protein [Bacteroidales bacterium]
MINLAVTTFSSLLSDYLKKVFKLNEDIVTIVPLINQEKTIPSNKIHIFLTNIERETGSGIKFGQQKSGNYYKSGGPSWQLNLYLMIAAVFNEKQYEESLTIMSGVTMFLQSNNSFLITNTVTNINVEPVNLSFSELSNLWSICGNMYYPSLLCKLRTLNIDSEEIKHFGRIIKQKDVVADKKNKIPEGYTEKNRNKEEKK